MKKIIYCLEIACVFAGLSVDAMNSESGFATQSAKSATRSVEESKKKRNLSLLLDDKSLQELSLRIDVRSDGVWDDIIRSGRDLNEESNQLLARPTSSPDINTESIKLLVPPVKPSSFCINVRFGNITVDRRKHQVIVGREQKKMNELECRIVEYLCIHGGRTATIDDITSHIFNNVHEASKNMVRCNICKLQRSLVDVEGRTYIYKVVSVHDGLREMRQPDQE